MTNKVTLNGKIYSDGASNEGDPNIYHLGNGGHRTNFIPLLEDMLVEAGVVETNAGEAAASASAAAADRQLAEGYKNGAAVSEGIAVDSAADAVAYATNAEDSLIPGTSDYSAYHWAKKAQGFAGGGTLAAIAADLDATASVVDYCIYIPALHDSDGGEKMLRGCRHTSWYDELGAFPAAVAVVAEASAVTLYDLTDLDGLGVPNAWKTFAPQATHSGKGFWYTGAYVGGVAMRNGQLVIGFNGLTNTNGGARIIDFAADKMVRYNSNASYCGYYSGIIDAEDSAFVLSNVSAIVNSVVNDVAITVLPDAPTDPDTGLAVPTIAVATDGGVSVITHDGDVWDLTNGSAPADLCSFTADNKIMWHAASGSVLSNIRVDSIPTADENVSNDLYSQGTSERFYYYQVAPNPKCSYSAAADTVETAVVHGGGKTAFGYGDRLSLLWENTTAPANGMVAYVSSTIPGHVLPGDVKGSWLASMDATNITGTELVTNGTFDTDATGWTEGNGATLSVVSNRLRVTNGASDFGYAYQALTTEVGKSYIVQLEYTAGTAAGYRVQVGSSIAGSELYQSAYPTTASTLVATFTAVGATSYLTILIDDVSGNYADFDNVSVRLADEDRSVNANALATYGTITKTAVDTGNDLVGYSGFSTSNYFEQPYNADLDYGTGDWYYMGWIKEAANGSLEYVLSRAHYSGSFSGSLIAMDVQADGTIRGRISDDGFSTEDNIASTQAVDDSTWHHVALVRSGPSLKLYIDGVSAASDVTITNATGSLSNANATLEIGRIQSAVQPLTNGALALWRTGAYAPGVDQIGTIYELERPLFNAGAKCTLSADAVTALAHDEVTDLLHVGTAAGRDVISGLTVVERDTTTSNITALAACDGIVGEGN